MKENNKAILVAILLAGALGGVASIPDWIIALKPPASGERVMRSGNVACDTDESEKERQDYATKCRPDGANAASQEGADNSPKLTDWIQACSAAGTVLLTIGLLVVTWRQVRVAKQQRLIASDQFSAFSALERPRVYPIIGKQNVEDATISYLIYDNPTSPTGFVQMPAVNVSFKNYGRSPAIITAIGASLTIGGSVAPKGHMHHWLSLPKEVVVMPGCATEETNVGRMDGSNDPTRDEFASFRAGETYWWLTGYVAYEDIINSTHITYFCWRYDHRFKAFEPEPPERNFTKSKEKKSADPEEHPETARMRAWQSFHSPDNSAVTDT